jgi:hypothetical protein
VPFDLSASARLSQSVSVDLIMACDLSEILGEEEMNNGTITGYIPKGNSRIH